MKNLPKIKVLDCRLRHTKNFLQVLNRRGVNLGIKPHSVLSKQAFLQDQRRLICIDPLHYRPVY
jgi:hypothetical protein